jgi:predicted dehydrogenase
LVDSIQGNSDKITFALGVTRTTANAADYNVNLGIPLSANFSDALSDTHVEAVLLATPHTKHAKK